MGALHDRKLARYSIMPPESLRTSLGKHGRSSSHGEPGDRQRREPTAEGGKGSKEGKGMHLPHFKVGDETKRHNSGKLSGRSRA